MVLARAVSGASGNSAEPAPSTEIPPRASLTELGKDVQLREQWMGRVGRAVLPCKQRSLSQAGVRTGAKRQRALQHPFGALGSPSQPTQSLNQSL